ncbi:MAG: serine hydrolase domain-containing protein [Gemmataceae bacterium]
MTRAAALLLLLVSPLAAEPPDLAPLREKVQTKLDALRAENGFPGASVAVAFADGRTLAATTGFADPDAKTPLTPADRILAGSVGKTFVSAVLLQLVEEGKVGLDDKLSKWLGEEAWFARLPNGGDLTVRHCLHHATGLPEYFEGKGFETAIKADPDREWKPAELLAYVLDVKPLFAAGKGWAYADTNYILVGMVAEKATGKPLFAEVVRRLVEPLKLDRTVPSDRRVIPDLAVGYAGPRNPLGPAGRTIVGGKLLTNPQFEWAGGGLASTPTDLARWAKAVYEGKAFRKPETLTLLLTGVDSAGGRGGAKGSQYGLGVMIRESPWGPSYGHGGWYPGYRTEVEYFPKHKTAIAVQFTTDQGPQLKKGLRAYIGDVARVVLPAG